MRLKFVVAAAIVAVSIPCAAMAESLGDREAAEIGGNVFKKLDANGDGTVDATEFQALVNHHVKKADKNGDGVVDTEEMGGAEANALIQMKEF
ncbi:MAG: hypothetical protein AB7S74_11075 [Hyphomicrobium sp.]